MSQIKKVSKAEVLEIREILRKLARGYLNTDQKIQGAAKATGTSYKYLKKALLGEKYKGGLDIWVSLLIVMARMDNSNLVERLREIASNPRLFREDSSLQSEKIFQKLNKIGFINEDVKYKIAETLEMILFAMENHSDKK